MVAAMHDKAARLRHGAAMTKAKPSREGWAMRLRGSAYEVRKRGIARFDLRDPYHLAVTLSWPAFIIGALVCLCVINFAFAGLYLLVPGAIQNLAPGDLADAAFFSLETLATVGYGEMAPATRYGHAVAAAEIVVGMAFTAILTGILFVRFSRPKARILFADQVVVARHNGLPTLMLRIGNGRLTMLLNARAHLGVLLNSVSEEGMSLRGVQKLALIRAEIPVFPLTWTIMHTIDDESPLRNFDLEMLAAHEARLFLSIEARDAATAAEVYDIREYGRDRIVFGARYSDMMHDEDGRVIADMAGISLIEPER